MEAQTSGEGEHACADAELNRELANLRRATEGTRNDTLNRASFTLGQVVAAGCWPEKYVIDLLLPNALATGLEESEALATIMSGMSAGMKEPRDLSNIGNGVPPSSATGEPELDAELSRLEGLSEFARERDIKNTARALGVTVAFIRKQLKKRLPEFEDSELQGQALELQEPEPWPTPTPPAALLDEIVAHIRRHVFLTPQQADSTALWVLATWAIDAFDRRASRGHRQRPKELGC